MAKQIFQIDWAAMRDTSDERTRRKGLAEALKHTINAIQEAGETLASGLSPSQVTIAESTLRELFRYYVGLSLTAAYAGADSYYYDCVFRMVFNESLGNSPTLRGVAL